MATRWADMLDDEPEAEAKGAKHGTLGEYAEQHKHAEQAMHYQHAKYKHAKDAGHSEHAKVSKASMQTDDPSLWPMPVPHTAHLAVPARMPFAQVMQPPTVQPRQPMVWLVCMAAPQFQCWETPQIWASREMTEQCSSKCPSETRGQTCPAVRRGQRCRHYLQGRCYRSNCKFCHCCF